MLAILAVQPIAVDEETRFDYSGQFCCSANCRGGKNRTNNVGNLFSFSENTFVKGIIILSYILLCSTSFIQLGCCKHTGRAPKTVIFTQKFMFELLNFSCRGYRLPFKDLSPTKCNLRNNKSAMNNSNFVETAILKLLADGKIEERTDIPFCVNPLTVAEGKKKRLVLDLRHVNKFLYQPKFRYEDLNSLAQVFEQDNWFFTWDLKSGYHHVNIYKPHHDFLGFSWAINGRPRYFVFRVLPFGLS